MENIDLTALEEYILERSADRQVTRRRRASVIISGLCFAALLIAFAIAQRSWIVLLSVALFYIAMTVWEKVSYANAVLAYKSVVQKLKKRVEELERQEGPGQDAAADS